MINCSCGAVIDVGTEEYDWEVCGSCGRDFSENLQPRRRVPREKPAPLLDLMQDPR